MDITIDPKARPCPGVERAIALAEDGLRRGEQLLPPASSSTTGAKWNGSRSRVEIHPSRGPVRQKASQAAGRPAFSAPGPR